MLKDFLLDDAPNAPERAPSHNAVPVTASTCSATGSQWSLWRVLHSTRGYCGSPGTVGTVDRYCRILWVLWVGLGTAQYPWVLQGTVGTAWAKIDRWLLHNPLGYCTVGTVGTA
jgi:hypothetical protein